MAKSDITPDGYKILQSVEIDGLEVAIGENPEAAQQYVVCRRSLDQPFGAESHLIPAYTNDYLEAFRDFIHCQSAYADNIGLDRVYRGSPATDAAITEKACLPYGMGGDLKGKIGVIRQDILSPEYRAASHQLMLITGGFGCNPQAHGRKVYGVNLYSGKEESWLRAEIAGVMSEDNLPGWAHDKLTRLREPQAKESALAKIREAKAAKAEPQAERKTPSPIKSDPEL